MNKPLISVIVPVYKVEKYLDRCIQSILNQTYANLEVILVDDGSPDKSPQICDEYALKDGRLKVIHKENGGLSSARNAGLDVAKGEYIAFVDSDDWIDNQMYSKLMNVIQVQNSDIACCSFSYVYDNEDSLEYCPYELPLHEESVITVESETYLQDFSKYAFTFLIITVNKLYRRSVFETIRFAEGKRCEDEIIFHEILINSKRISVIKDSLYFYYQSQQSITRGNDNWKNWCYLIEALRARAFCFYQTEYSKSAEQCLSEYYLTVIREWDTLKRFSTSRAREERLYYRQLTKELRKCKELSRKTQILIKMFSYAPNIVHRIYHSF